MKCAAQRLQSLLSSVNTWEWLIEMTKLMLHGTSGFTQCHVFMWFQRKSTRAVSVLYSDSEGYT